MFKKLFYRIKAFFISLFTPSADKVIAKTIGILETVTANYDAALDAEADLRLASYNRQFDISNQERLVRDLSDDRARSIRSQRMSAAYAADRLKDSI
jgi:hypothetical protein